MKTFWYCLSFIIYRNVRQPLFWSQNIFAPGLMCEAQGSRVAVAFDCCLFLNFLASLQHEHCIVTIKMFDASIADHRAWLSIGCVPLWTETLWPGHFGLRHFGLRPFGLRPFGQRHFGWRHFGPRHYWRLTLDWPASCPAHSYSLILRYISMSKILCLLWTRQSYMTLWRLRKNTQIFSLFILTLKCISE